MSFRRSALGDLRGAAFRSIAAALGRRRSALGGLAVLATCAAASSCGPSRTASAGPSTPVGLSNGVALVDDTDHQVVILTASSSAGTPLARTTVSVGHGIAAAVASADGSMLLVLSKGDAQPTTAAPPSLTTIQIDPTTLAVTSVTYPMPTDEPCQSLAVDPAGQWAVAYNPLGFVENPNELLIFDLTGAHPTPVEVSLQSFGGTPWQMTFTPPLLVDQTLGAANGGDRHLLIVETQIDVSLLDLDHAFDPSPPPEITIPLTSSSSGEEVTPAAIAVDSLSSTEFALRASNSSSVFLFTFGPPGPADKNDFSPILNETAVGGIPSDMAFVLDDQGKVGLAVLVPSTSSAVLVDPTTSTTSTVALPSSYANMSLVTGAVPTASNGDVALLWNGSAASGVALWTVGEPYFSIDVTGVSSPIATVLDVPNTSLKVLEPSDASAFFVLDLSSGRVTPLETMSQATLSISPDGQRIWAYSEGAAELSCIDLDDFSTVPVTTTAPIDFAYEIDGAGTSRDLVALDTQGTPSATVFDALSPTTAPQVVAEP